MPVTLPSIIPSSLVSYVEACILPRYSAFDPAHRIDHARMVIDQSLQLAAEHPEVSAAMAYVIAAYHDLGLCDGRATHHTASARIIRADATLLRWFTPDEISTMADAAEDHRASAKEPPRTIYGRIVAEADRFIDPVTIIRRTVQYGLDHYPEIAPAEHYERTLQHLREKYGDGGYLRLWFPHSPNVARLERLRAIIRQPEQLRSIFDDIWANLHSAEPDDGQ